MAARSPAERALIARIAAAARWSRTADRAAATTPARAALQERFERQVDPNHELAQEDRARRARAARTEFYARLQLASLRSRRRTPKPPAGGDV